MEECLFCKIADGSIPANKAYEDDDVVAFHDINPQAPVHILVIPRKHITSINEIARMNAGVLKRMFEVLHDLAASNRIDKDGYRTVINTGLKAGQSVDHMHAHLLGGRPMSWPPG
ncbi:MAG: histidine triad nucleotide-binding protein [Actinobacteria bacterium]|nr:histidine triad nucleotide-binding protein [Actinomycetota bacterium]